MLNFFFFLRVVRLRVSGSINEFLRLVFVGKLSKLESNYATKLFILNCWDPIVDGDDFSFSFIGGGTGLLLNPTRTRDGP